MSVPFKLTDEFKNALLNGEANVVGGKTLLDGLQVGLLNKGKTVRITFMQNDKKIMYMDVDARLDDGNTVTLTGLTILGEVRVSTI